MTPVEKHDFRKGSAEYKELDRLCFFRRQKFSSKAKSKKFNSSELLQNIGKLLWKSATKKNCPKKKSLSQPRKFSAVDIGIDNFAAVTFSDSNSFIVKFGNGRGGQKVGLTR